MVAFTPVIPFTNYALTRSKRDFVRSYGNGLFYFYAYTLPTQSLRKPLLLLTTMEHLPVDIGKVASIRFNVMVVGEIGCGKTTFLESFPRGYSDDQNTLHGAALDAHLHFIDTTEVPEVDATVEGNIDGAVQRPGWSVLNISNVDVLPEYLVSKHREWVKISTKLVISDEVSWLKVMLYITSLLLLYLLCMFRSGTLRMRECTACSTSSDRILFLSMKRLS